MAAAMANKPGLRLRVSYNFWSIKLKVFTIEFVIFCYVLWYEFFFLIYKKISVVFQENKLWKLNIKIILFYELFTYVYFLLLTLVDLYRGC